LRDESCFLCQSFLILLFGAEFSAEYRHLRRGEESG
jgi:hypothetical protein